jgi:hypothetical protein
MKTLLADRGARCLWAAANGADRLEVSVSFDEQRGYVGTAPELSSSFRFLREIHPTPVQRDTCRP